MSMTEAETDTCPVCGGSCDYYGTHDPANGWFVDMQYGCTNCGIYGQLVHCGVQDYEDPLSPRKHVHIEPELGFGEMYDQARENWRKALAMIKSAKKGGAQ